MLSYFKSVVYCNDILLLYYINMDCMYMTICNNNETFQCPCMIILNIPKSVNFLHQVKEWLEFAGSSCVRVVSDQRKLSRRFGAASILGVTDSANTADKG